MKYVLILIFFGLIFSCQSKQHQENTETIEEIIPGAYQIDQYLPLLEGRKVGVVANHTSLVGDVHLVDTLRSLGVNIIKVFSPEHGFRGDADAGAHVDDSKDPKTGLEIVSLYGANRKPSEEMMEGIDMMVYDIQDVGIRFYTYISTMHYTMESAAERKIPYLVLDRPNPNGYYVDGPVLDLDLKSFVGMHPIPVVYGLTIGESAKMINEEGWLNDGIKVDLTIIPIQNYDHSSHYSLPVKPSPNLPNDQAIMLYPSTCLFEGTIISEGRGTYDAFQVVGHPTFKGIYDFSFTPVSIKGMASKPKYENEECFGLDLRNEKEPVGFTLKYLIEFYNNYKGDEPFFNTYILKLIGDKRFTDQVKSGLSEEEIKATWEEGLATYKLMRKKYLLYPDYE